MKFSIGEQVVIKQGIHPYSDYAVWKVLHTIDNAVLLEVCATAYDEVIVPIDGPELGSRGWRSGIERFQEEELCTVEEVLVILHSLEADKNRLDKEFDDLREQIRSKLDQAAALVKEAVSVAATHEKTFFHLKDECMELYKVLAEGGWSHSSMSC